MKVILLVAYLLIFKQKAFVFDVADYNILKKLDHHGLREISNKWFESYLTDWNNVFQSIALI